MTVDGGWTVEEPAEVNRKIGTFISGARLISITTLFTIVIGHPRRLILKGETIFDLASIP